MPPRKKSNSKSTKKDEIKPVEEKHSSSTASLMGVTFILTTIVVVSLMYSWHAKEMKKIEILNSKSCIEVAQLNAEQQNTITKLKDDIATMKEETQNIQQRMKIVETPKDGWEQYIPIQPDENDENAKPAVSKLVDKTIEEIRDILGEPPVLFRDYPKKQIWVYHTSTEDNTALYVTFEQDTVVDVIEGTYIDFDSLTTL